MVPKAIIIDFSRVLIFPLQEGIESLNKYHEQLARTPGYHVLDHFELNHELLDRLDKISKKIPVCIFTDGRLHELTDIKLHLKDIFTEMHTVDSLGLDKKQPQSYLEFATRIGVKPADILFIDDKIANVAAAKEAGLQTIHYTSNQPLLTYFTSILPLS